MKVEPLPPRKLGARAGPLGRAFLCGIAAAILAVLVTQFLPKTYRAEAKILPAASGGTGSALLDLANSSGVSELFGGGLQGPENPALSYPEILSSGALLQKVLAHSYPIGGKGTLLDALDIKTGTARQRVFRGVKQLRASTTIAANPRSGLISVIVVSRDSVLSAFIANTLLEELDRFNVESRASRGRALRQFIERRLDESKAELTKAEGALAGFRQSNLRIGNSPQLVLEQARYERQVEMASDIYRMLGKQYELARIEEQRDTPTFSVIDPAVPPVRKYRPSAVLNALLAALVVAGIVFGSEYIGSDRFRVSLQNDRVGRERIHG